MKHNYTSRFQGMINYLKKIRIPSKVIFITAGILSTIWFLLRVIPKPSRLTYPCMKAAAPLASSFITYLIGIASLTFLFRKARERLLQSKYLMASLFIFLGLSAGLVAILNNQTETWALDMQGPQVGNEPIGVGKGVFPGRVVWIHNVEATDETCTNSGGDYWYQDSNTDIEVVNEMLSDGLQKLSGKSTDSEAWDAIFKNYNSTHGKGEVGYSTGEKIVIKINMNAIWGGDAGINTSPQVCYAILNQLINVVGVAQTDISIGDPNCSMNTVTYNKLHDAFPDVTYWGNGGGMTQVVASATPVFIASDGSTSDVLPQSYLDASYLINIPVFKKHHRAGISISSKNHFGSIAPFTGGAWHLHPSLPVPDANDPGGNNENGEYGVYRGFVDIMGHKDLGGKTLLHLVDGIWGSINWGHPAIKWEMTPFNNDWPNSLFLSMDPVAVQSVCFDFLYEEFDEDHPTEGIAFLSSDHGPFPHFPGTDDFLHQAASPDLWPAGFEYDPENDGSILTSLGTHEHWNNAIDKKYTRNLGIGEGIELITRSYLPPPYGPTITMENSDLPSNQVNTLYIDSSMTVWIGTDAGISRLVEEGWKQYDTILFSNGVNDIAYELTGYGKELWIATDSGLTVAAYNDIDGITSATTYVPENSSLVGHIVSAVTVDADHNRWVGTDSAISVFRGNVWDSQLTGIDWNNNSFLFADDIITDIEIYADTQALIATMGQGINRMSYDLVDGFTGASTYTPPWSGINTKNITAIDVNGEEQWYGTDTGAYFHLNNLTKENWTGYNADSGVVNNLINTVVIDEDDNAWLGTPDGISIVISDGGIFNYTEADGLINNMVNYLTTDINGNIWAATSGGIQWFSNRVGVQVALGIPDIISPEYGANDQELSVDLSWTAITGATKYLVQVATDYSFSTIVADLDNVSSPTTTISDLVVETTYYWRVAAASATLTSAWSYGYTFTTLDLGVPELIAPANGENDVEIVADLSWSSVSGATEYWVQVATDESFATIVAEVENESSASLTTPELDYSTSYYWRVAAKTASITGTWSAISSFTTQAPDGIINFNGDEISIFPTPFNSYLMIKGSEFTGTSILSIYSLDGKLELQQVVDKKENRIYTSEMREGIYILRIADGSKFYSCKIVK